MLPKEIKRIPKRLMMELVYATNAVVNFIRRDGGIHPVMSLQHIVVGRRLVTPPYPAGSFVYGVPRSTSNSTDKMGTFGSLYLRSNEEGGGTLCIQHQPYAEKLSSLSQWCK